MKGSAFNTSADNMFMEPKNGKISDLIYIADNTFMFNCLMAYMNGSTCASITTPQQNVMLDVEVKVTYTMFDKWFIMTMVFSVLNVLALITAVGLWHLQKKKREEYQNFRKHKEKWFNNDSSTILAKIKSQ
jgi:hypothetical protein